MKAEIKEQTKVAAGSYDAEFAAWLERNEQKDKKGNFFREILNTVLKENQHPANPENNNSILGTGQYSYARKPLYLHL